ncbi:MAG: DNA gyrase subunit A, partial [Oscillospiraceae bacterium]
MNYEGKIIGVDIESEMKKSYLDYSMSVIVGRALPDVRDGLKPVHRRILYTMYLNGLTPDKGFRKSADTVGSVLGKFHPHGDSSVYDAMVRMAQDFSMRHPLVHGHGNFGSVDGDPPAAYRYTEAKMSKISMAMMQDIDKETVDFVPNYDDNHVEPSFLPSRFPNLLVNGSTGIAVGMATNIPPHNLGEVIDCTCHLIDNPDSDLEELMEYIQGPDLPTGGTIMGKSGIRAAYATGRGKILVRATANIEQGKNGRERIIVTEIPYMVNKARLVESIADLVKDKRIDSIADLTDESSARTGMRVVVTLKKDANAQIVLNQLYKLTQMQETIGIILLALCDGEPKVMTLKQILEQYIIFQISVITRRTQFELKKAQDRLHILDGLMIALDFIDEVIKILRAAPDQNTGKNALMERFGLTDIQSAAIVAMRLGQLTGLERKKIEDELEQVKFKVADFMDILANEYRVTNIIKEDLQEIKNKYADERRTNIVSVSGEVDIEDLIPVEDCVVTLTHFGYVKRQPMDVYKTQHRGGRGVAGMTRREEDFVEELFVCSTHDYLMFFTNKGKVYRIKAYEIAESSRASRGDNIINILPLEKEEKVTSVIQVDELEKENHHLVMVTRKGIIKRTELTQYKNVRKNGLIAITLDEDDELAWVRITSGNSDLIVATQNGMAIRFNENDARAIGRTARGVKAINLDEDDIVIGFVEVRENADLLTISESGLGRRTPLTEYSNQNRGGKGSRNYYTQKNGKIAGVRIVDDNDDIIIITNDGIIIRIPVSQISTQSRYASGVRV